MHLDHGPFGLKGEIRLVYSAVLEEEGRQALPKALFVILSAAKDLTCLIFIRFFGRFAPSE
jgi:hypothetical protein